jgi:queuine tRNA-ribosyltransferase/7-cyano-7-deazaguanine tRNA-ribosyltransferase
MERTHRWAACALEQFKAVCKTGSLLFGIVQGGIYPDLREKSAAFLGGEDFSGYAIGGSLGKSKDEMYQVLEWTIPILPEKKPRHLLGIGEIDDIFEIVSRGIDLFDCIAPTRMARTGTFFSKLATRFRIHILNTKFKEDPRPIEEMCNCYTCRNYSRAYLRHLFMAKELLGTRLAVIHNLSFIESLMRQIRHAIKAQQFSELAKEWLHR